MQIVIDIDDDYYFEIKNAKVQGDTLLTLEQAVIDGTPLPNGHGRLIDANEVIKIANKTKDLHGAIWNTPTIIEADKGDKE